MRTGGDKLDRATTMSAVKEDERSVYLAEFSRVEKELGRVGPASLQHTRKAAIARFGEVGFPTLHDEEWRFTNLAPLTRTQFRLSTPELEYAPGTFHGDLPDDATVFMNGFAVRTFLMGRLPEGVIASGLSDALRQYGELIAPYLARFARIEDNPFTALNTAFLRHGAFVYVPRGIVVEAPVHLEFLSESNGEPTVSHPRNLIVIQEGAQATVVESYLGPEGENYFTNAVTEILLGEGAVLDHYKVQEESKSAFHIATMQVQQARGSNFSSHSITLGGALVRNEANVVLDAENCECTLNGLYLGGGTQLIDNHTRIDHAKPHCTSHELYKGILDGQSRGVFNGKIYVHPDAQKTDAKQTNKTLLLSDDAVIDTKPQLEIFADDVKCTHGATIGQLDADSIFYLRSRGIGLAEARSLLTYAFANDIVGRIKVDAVRSRLERVLLTQQNLPLGKEEAS